MPDYQYIDSAEIAWRKSGVASGMEVKDLGTANGRSMQLVRFAPGTTFPLHRHSGPEFIYMLEGAGYQEGQRLSTGWASVAATGSIDTAFHTPDGCLFLTVYTE
jgi:anti-sigma factor ChrR (cupin superfamily)